MPEVVIIGAGGVGREIATVLRHPSFHGTIMKGFIDDGRTPEEVVKGLPVLGGIEWLFSNPGYAVIIAIGSPVIRKKIVDQLGDGFDFPTVIHPNARLHDKDSITIGKGCYIADGTILTTDIKVGDFCFINTSCSLQHDTVLESYCVLMPGVRITGGAKIGAGTYVAPNCAISSSVVLQAGSIVKETIY